METEHESATGAPLAPRFPIDPGTLEALKWLAVLLMTLDHVNRYLLNGAQAWMYQSGRLALPLFVFVLAYNLARPEAEAKKLAWRVCERLIPFAAVASLPFYELNVVGSGPLPINILFTLAAGAAIVALIEQPTRTRELLAILLFTGLGAIVDYGWNGLALFIASWQFFRQPGRFWAIASLLLLALLFQVNLNFWALACLPVIALAFRLRLPVRRLRGALYYYYPLHLCVLVVLQITLFDR